MCKVLMGSYGRVGFLRSYVGFLCKFNGNIYEQMDGISMGSPIAPLNGRRVHELDIK